MSHLRTVRLLRVAGIALAFLHLFPARKHLGALFAHPSLADAWKGVGAAAAIALLLAPARRQLGALEKLRRARWGWAALAALALVHLVPAAHHLPSFFAAPGFGDAWRGFGAVLAAAVLAGAAALRARRALLVALRGRLAAGAAAVAVSLALAAMTAGCSQDSGLGADGGHGEGGASGAACPPCVSDTDCSGGVCAQLGGDSYCAPACPMNGDCGSGRACVSVMTSSGQSANVCAPTSGACAVSGDGGDAPPGDAGVGLPDAGPVSGSVGPNGGTVSRLYFAAVGDTRPPIIDDTSGYPSAIIQKIFGDVEALNPRPTFVVATGDYNFSSAYSGTAAATQIGLYVTARSNYSGTVFPTMGNHECTGATDSNCGPNSTSGLTNNYNAFMSKMLGPIGKSTPYYSVTIDDTNHQWTSKFVFVAANAWNQTQAAWLDQTLSQATTYTFIVRHEPRDATTAPGVTPSEQIMAKHPYTLSVVGHTHSYYHSTGSREVLFGNGGAPLTGYKNYGYGLFSQRQDGAIQVDEIDYQTGLADSYFRFVVKPDGSPTK